MASTGQILETTEILTLLCGLSTKTHVPLWERVKTYELCIYVWESRQRNSLPRVLPLTAVSRTSAESVDP